MKVTAIATRTGDWWAVEVPEVDGAFTQAKRLDQIPALVRDAVALLEEIPEDSIEVDVVPDIDDGVDATLSLARLQREEAAELNREAAELVAQAARRLVESGMTLRDVGIVVGVSHQRVGQILEAAPTGATGDWLARAQDAVAELRAANERALSVVVKDGARNRYSKSWTVKNVDGRFVSKSIRGAADGLVSVYSKQAAAEKQARRDIQRKK